MKKVGDILSKFNPLEDKYISREFQSYGYHLAEVLNDMKHKSLYIKLSKNIPRPLLEKALEFTADAKVKRKGALFMWKLKELGAWKKEKKEKPAFVKTSAGKERKVKDIPF
ncbi:hypothetical protein A2153_03690 [Candidatus Gottesmanbacteria bacterium RBG_16_38_7b]|uniref:Uncharacterized protein n=2 Tax=Candidatus Gottesmaniibacteriota TaxID=1752720 RepID=A0A1F5YHH2_9BACT|nr:MAG: hypothetical protein A2153_03690 [Candidatus Gottesmanbacteria bacterium RBG_16_38_7b]OGG32266.1 MAG: hypothetical protein A3I51_02860 [Candidatus Gottesmanbacteria bacterium RIFCSPLOWO2_02_FULL_38_8]